MWSPFSWDTIGHLSAFRRTEKVGGLRDAALSKFLWSHRHMVSMPSWVQQIVGDTGLQTCFWDHKGCDNFLRLVTLVTNKWLWFANGFYNSCALEFLNFSPSFLQFLDQGFDLQVVRGQLGKRCSYATQTLFISALARLKAKFSIWLSGMTNSTKWVGGRQSELSLLYLQDGQLLPRVVDGKEQWEYEKLFQKNLFSLSLFSFQDEE